MLTAVPQQKDYMLHVIDGIQDINQAEEVSYDKALDIIYPGQPYQQVALMEEYHDHQTVPVYLQIKTDDWVIDSGR